MRHVIPISGKDSLATALVMKKRQPDLPYEFVFNPTGAELPVVFEWIDKVEVYLGSKIHRVGADLIEIIEDYNGFLPSGQSRYCTRMSKIEPFEKWIGKSECTVYYGIRADEERGGYENAKFPNIRPAYPLKEEGICIEDVYRMINEAGLKPPAFFWQSVYDEVVRKVGESLLRSLFTDWQLDVLFCWRTRANCYFCFNQRQSEWIGLFEHHPDLFWKAESMEHGGSEYFWNGKDQPLVKLLKRAPQIKRKHINRILKTIMDVKIGETKQMTLFGTDSESGFRDYFQTTSCGLFCGK